MDLRTLGWTEDLAGPLAALGGAPLRVSAAHHGAVDALGASGPVRLPLRPGTQSPAVGDWIAVEAGEPPRLLGQLPRRSALIRQAAGRATAPQVLAANVDLALIVTAVGGDFSERRVERYLALAHGGGVTPVVVVNKIDRDLANMGRWLRQATAVAPDTQVLTATTRWDGGLDDLVALLVPGRTVALLGSSGVGKSSIVNALLGDEAIATRPVRRSDDTGRHTTTSRQLHALPGGRGLLIDTPGLRELALWDTAGLDEVFSDLTLLAEGCRYRGCSHSDEPGCAVIAAVEAGELDPARLESWRALQREATARQALRDPTARKAAGRDMAQRVREATAERRRRGR
ncbi:MAG: ribosome small subunit-dependent GTPase A [Deltaproteobacteria bacterium]|nr:ribosome small subunit-dependent GTPase A [Deltaproteobacteria bacterium]